MGLSPKITDAGYQAIYERGDNVPLEITHIGLSTYGFTPNGAETVIQDEIIKKPIDGSVKLSSSSIQFYLNIKTDNSSGIWIPTLSFYSGDVLFAIASSPNENILYLSPDSEIVVSYTVSFSDTSAEIEGSSELSSSLALKLIGDQAQLIREEFEAKSNNIGRIKGSNF